MGMSITVIPRQTDWSRFGDWLLDVPGKVLAIVVGALIVRWLAHRLITGFVSSILAGQEAAERDRTPTTELPVVRRHARLALRRMSTPARYAPLTSRQSGRVLTLGSMLRSAATIIVIVVAILMIGDVLGINMTPILASASIGGVALAFGAQSLVKDFLSGVFMLIEDQYGVGDVIDTGQVTGTVIDISLRVTTIRDGDGAIWYVPNGQIMRVGNKSKGWSTATVDVPVPVSSDLDKVRRVVQDAVAQGDAPWADEIIEPPTVVGIEGIADGAVTVRVTAKCHPNQSATVATALRRAVLDALSAARIRLTIVAAHAGVTEASGADAAPVTGPIPATSAPAAPTAGAAGATPAVESGRRDGTMDR